MIVEYRYVTGEYYRFNQTTHEQEKLTFEEELQMNREVLDEVRKHCPYFQLKLIFTHLKFMGKPMLQTQIDNILKVADLKDEKLKELIAPGIDMVGEEDSNNQINHYVE